MKTVYRLLPIFLIMPLLSCTDCKPVKPKNLSAYVAPVWRMPYDIYLDGEMFESEDYGSINFTPVGSDKVTASFFLHKKDHRFHIVFEEPVTLQGKLNDVWFDHTGTATVEIGDQADPLTVPATLSGRIADKPLTRCSPREPEFYGEIDFRFTMDGRQYQVIGQLRPV